MHLILFFLREKREEDIILLELKLKFDYIVSFVKAYYFTCNNLIKSVLSFLYYYLKSIQNFLAASSPVFPLLFSLSFWRTIKFNKAVWLCLLHLHITYFSSLYTLPQFLERLL